MSIILRAIESGVVLSAMAGMLIAQAPSSPADADRSRAGVVSSGKSVPKEEASRTIEGIVTDASHNPIARAIVQLKDTRTLQIRSFVTQADGTYRFTGLSDDVDYEVKAVVGEQSTPTKRVSSFNSRKLIPVNLELEKK